MENIEKKLAEDYKYYMGYTETFANRVNEVDRNLCRVINNSHLINYHTFQFLTFAF